MIPRALTIAGSDPSGGAGIQADLKTFTVFGVFGMSAITALTVQNTVGVSALHPVPAAIVEEQIRSVITDIGVDATKIGMLADATIVTAVARTVRAYRIHPVVLDPVMAAQGGVALLAADACRALVRELLPLADLVTPNIPEAEVLTGTRIRSVADMRAAARALRAQGARACLLKGGHLAADQAFDVFDDGTGPHEFVAERIATRHTHGTGCQLSAAIAANLARGLPLRDAVALAKQFITVAIRHGLALGRGTGPANPMAWGEAGVER